MVRNHKLRTIFLGQPPKKRCLYFVTYSLFCIFAVERLRSCSRSDIDASIMFLAKPQFCAENIYIY